MINHPFSLNGLCVGYPAQMIKISNISKGTISCYLHLKNDVVYWYFNCFCVSAGDYIQCCLSNFSVFYFAN